MLDEGNYSISTKPTCFRGVSYTPEQKQSILDQIKSRPNSTPLAFSTSSDVPTDGDIASKYKIHSSLEENESTSFLSSIYSFILDYVSSTSGSINRFPLDVGVNDCFTSHYYFVNLNLLVYIMFMAVLYFSICNVAFLSLTYIQAKLKYWFPKTTLGKMPLKTVNLQKILNLLLGY